MPPSRPRRLFPLAAFLACSAAAQLPPEGKYRCYQPPAYTVTAWFELGAATVRVNGGEAQALRLDPAGGRIDWPADALPPHRHGYYFPPGAAGGDAERHTIVLAPRAGLRPGQPAWARLPRCYQITH